MSGEGGCVLGNTDHQSASILVHIVDALRDGNTAGVGAEVVIIDAPRGAFPTTPGMFEMAHQFAFLAIDADDRQRAVLEAAA